MRASPRSRCRCGWQTELGELSFISTVATFGTAVEVTASELSIESFFPADERTAEAVRSYVARRIEY